MLHRDQSPKPAAVAFANMTRNLYAAAQFYGEIKSFGADARCYLFRKEDESIVLALWQAEEKEQDITIPVGEDAVTVADLGGGWRTAQCPGQELSTTISGSPIFVHGANLSVLQGTEGFAGQ